MSVEQFWLLPEIVDPFILKNDKHYRKCIYAAEGLALTLQFLVTGDAQ